MGKEYPEVAGSPDSWQFMTITINKNVVHFHLFILAQKKLNYKHRISFHLNVDTIDLIFNSEEEKMILNTELQNFWGNY